MGIGLMATLIAIEIQPDRCLMSIGETTQFTATALYNNSTTGDITASVAWSCSDPTMLSIDAMGLATALAAGTGTIQAISGTIIGTASARVTRTVTAIEVTPANPVIAAGKSQQFVATATFDDTSTDDITALALWSSSLPAVAQVGDTGLAIGVKEGNALIQAATGTATGSTNLQITGAGGVVPLPSEVLAQAQRQMFLLLSGQLPQAVETPQLGRVQFLPTSSADLQRLIDYLQGLVAAGDTWDPTAAGSMTTGYTRGRKPFSFQAWP